MPVLPIWKDYLRVPTLWMLHNGKPPGAWNSLFSKSVSPYKDHRPMLWDDNMFRLLPFLLAEDPNKRFSATQVLNKLVSMN